MKIVPLKNKDLQLLIEFARKYGVALKELQEAADRLEAAELSSNP